LRVAKVRFGSNSDLDALKREVRFALSTDIVCVAGHFRIVP